MGSTKFIYSFMNKKLLKKRRNGTKLYSMLLNLDLLTNIQKIFLRLSFWISVQDAVFLLFTGTEVVLELIPGNTSSNFMLGVKRDSNEIVLLVGVFVIENTHFFK